MTRAAVVVRLAGGLGNQLFQYAFGRAVAIRSQVPLVVDVISEFVHDPFRRTPSLSFFNVSCDYLAATEALTTPRARLRWRVRRRLAEWLPLERRRIVLERGRSRFDPAIGSLRVNERTYFDGYWQHHEYFQDIRDELLRDLSLKRTPARETLEIADRLRGEDAVAVHVRCLRDAACNTPTAPRLGIDPGYYARAIGMITERLAAPKLYVFSDEPAWVRQHIPLPCPHEYLASGSDHEDLWLMSQCRGFVIGNSTYGWWGAWLSTRSGSCIVAPRSGVGHGIRSVPPDWHLA